MNFTILNFQKIKSKRSSSIISLVLICIASFVTYSPIIHNQFILVDDSDQIINQPQIRSLTHIPQLFASSTYYRPESQQSYGLFYRPLMLSFYTLLYALNGPNPVVYHLFQLGLHVINAWLIYLFVQSLTSEIKDQRIPLLAASMFALHPINSETVLHAANLQDVLFVSFGLLSLLITNSILNSTNHPKPSQLFILGLLLSLSLFAKETGILFLLTCFILALLKHPSKQKSLLFPFITSLLTYTLFRFQLAKVSLGFDSIAKITTAPLPLRLLHAPLIIGEYLQTFLYPVKLTIFQYWFYKDLQLHHILSTTTGLLIGLSILVGIGLKVNYQQHRLRQIYWLALSMLLLGLAMHSQIIPLSQTIALRWFYFASIGASILIAIGLNTLLNYPNQKIKPLAYPVLIIALLLLMLRTHTRVYDWKDSETLFTHDLNEQPQDNYFLQNSLASVYLESGKFDQAKPLIETSVEQYPYFGNLANLALIYAHEQNEAKAIEYFEKSLAKQTNYTAYQNYANVLYYQFHLPQKALAISEQALQWYPYADRLWTIVALSQADLGNHAEAYYAARRAYTLNPNQEIEVIFVWRDA